MKQWYSNDYEEDGEYGYKTCSICYATVYWMWVDDHEEWHKGVLK